MKRITAIFSLIVMMIVAIQPVIAMHYCGNELSSLQIYQTNGVGDFCCEGTDYHDVLISDNFCCETEMIKLSTDEYQTKTEQSELRVSPISTDTLGYTLISQLITNKSEANSFLTSLKFPTKGLYLEDVSILTYICIYRI